MRFHLLALFLLLVPTAVGAAPIQIDFTGTVTSATGIWVGQGAAVTGFYVYDSGLVDTDPSNTRDDFRLNAASDFAFGEISITVGAITLTTATNPNPVIAFQIDDAAFGDSYLFEGLVTFLTDNHGRIRLDDVPPADGAGVGSGNLAGVLPLTAPDLSLWDFALGSFSAGQDGIVDFEVDSISLAEPSVGLIAGSLLLLAWRSSRSSRRRAQGESEGWAPALADGNPDEAGEV